MIFYFSATGNSLYAAQTLAESEQTECVSMADIMNSRSKEDEFVFQLKTDEPVGIVVPSYFCGLPSIVSEFAAKLRLEPVQGHYVFLVMTYGGAMVGAAAGMLRKALARQGIPISAAFSISAIDSYIPMFPLPEKCQAEKILKNADSQLAQICIAVRKRETTGHNCPQGLGARLSTAMMYPAYKNGRKTSKFTVSDACISCGLCEKVCPDSTIHLENGKPVWVKKSCVCCLGCLHRCPVNAIDYGVKTKGRERYLNPYISAENKFL